MHTQVVTCKQAKQYCLRCTIYMYKSYIWNT